MKKFKSILLKRKLVIQRKQEYACIGGMGEDVYILPVSLNTLVMLVGQLINMMSQNARLGNLVN